MFLDLLCRRLSARIVKSIDESNARFQSERGWKRALAICRQVTLRALLPSISDMSELSLADDSRLTSYMCSQCSMLCTRAR